MVIQLSDNFVHNTNEQFLSDLVYEIAFHRHTLDTTNASFNHIHDIVNKHASSSQKECIDNADCFSKSKLDGYLSGFMTTINADDFPEEQLLALVQKEPVLVLENGYEMDVYCSIMNVYAKNGPREIRSIAAHLSKIFSTDSYLNGGGYAGIVPEIEHRDKGSYKGTLIYKCVPIIDRDTNSFNNIPNDKNIVFHFLQGSTGEMTNDDIYSLKQQRFYWHLWAYREIENYIPKQKFKDHGCNVVVLSDDVENYHYEKIKHDPKKTGHGAKKIDYVGGYYKSEIGEIAKSMTYQDWESAAPKFTVDGKEMSEIELLLRKIAKIA